MSPIGSCDLCGATWQGEYVHCVKPGCCQSFTSDTGHLLHLGRLGCSDPSRLRNKKGERVFKPTRPKGSSVLVWAIANGSGFQSRTSHDTYGEVSAPSPSQVAV